MADGHAAQHLKGGRCDEDEVAARGGSRGVDPSSLLEHSQNVVMGEEGEKTYEVAKCGCDCWYCPDCCERKGYNRRAELIPILESFTNAMMLTLTVDPELFDSPQEAYLYIRDQRAISRLMRELDEAGYLHTRRYFYVVEFQTQTEQAHFHVLVDATRIPKEAIDRAWSRMRPQDAGPQAPNRPAFGMTRFSVPKFDGGPAHAARYATKYLVKTPEDGWPAWVMSMGVEHRVPRYGTSRGFWEREPQPSNPTGKKRKLNPRTYAMKVADCGIHSNLFEVLEYIDVETGELTHRYQWLARLGVDEALLALVGPEVESGRCRLTLQASNVRSALQLVQNAAGHPVQVISGLGAGTHS